VANEWSITNYGDSGACPDIIHHTCSNTKRGKVVWDTVYMHYRATRKQKDKLWTCMNCGKKCPEHVVFQWKVASGK